MNTLEINAHFSEDSDTEGPFHYQFQLVQKSLANVRNKKQFQNIHNTNMGMNIGMGMGMGHGMQQQQHQHQHQHVSQQIQQQQQAQQQAQQHAQQQAQQQQNSQIAQNVYMNHQMSSLNSSLGNLSLNTRNKPPMLNFAPGSSNSIAGNSAIASGNVAEPMMMYFAPPRVSSNNSTPINGGPAAAATSISNANVSNVVGNGGVGGSNGLVTTALTASTTGSTTASNDANSVLFAPRPTNVAAGQYFAQSSNSILLGNQGHVQTSGTSFGTNIISAATSVSNGSSSSSPVGSTTLNSANKPSPNFEAMMAQRPSSTLSTFIDLGSSSNGLKMNATGGDFPSSAAASVSSAGGNNLVKNIMSNSNMSVSSTSTPAMSTFSQSISGQGKSSLLFDSDIFSSNILNVTSAGSTSAAAAAAAANLTSGTSVVNNGGTAAHSGDQLSSDFFDKSSEQRDQLGSDNGLTPNIWGVQKNNSMFASSFIDSKGFNYSSFNTNLRLGNTNNTNNNSTSTSTNKDTASLSDGVGLSGFNSGLSSSFIGAGNSAGAGSVAGTGSSINSGKNQRANFISDNGMSLSSYF